MSLQPRWMDTISKLPPGIIETILCCLPIQEAARTSILSKEWRYRWIKIPKLAFFVDTFQVSTNRVDVPNHRSNMTKRCRFFYAIFQVLSVHEGPIHEFTLSMDADDSCVEIDLIILRLMKKNTVKKLTVDLLWEYRLPTSLFSLRQLTDLCLIHCELTDLCLVHCELLNQPTFDGFGSLTSLCLETVLTSKETLLHLLSNCPLLKTLDIRKTGVEVTNDSTIINLFECLPVIENLSINFFIIEYLSQDVVPQELPTPLVHLKYLCIEGMSFIHKLGLPIFGLLIRSSPNLENLKIEILDYLWLEESKKSYSSTVDDYLDIWLEHLNKLEIICMIHRKIDMDVVKLILAKSPLLKKVKIFLDNKVTKAEGLEILRIIYCSTRASPMVDIVVKCV